MYKPQVFKFRLPFDDSDCGGNGCVDDNAVFDRVRAILDKFRTLCFTYFFKYSLLLLNFTWWCIVGFQVTTMKEFVSMARIVRISSLTILIVLKVVVKIIILRKVHNFC